MTLLWLLAAARPAPAAAQAIGTIQVTAEVSRADAAWAGLSAAQQVARDLAAAPNAGSAQRLDLSLTRAELEFPVPAPTPAGHGVRPVISIQYLHN